MGVNSEVTGVECDEREYPWLGFIGEMVVLFSAHGVGTIVVAPENELISIGEHDADWDMDMFEAFEGEVKLTNDDSYDIDELLELED